MKTSGNTILITGGANGIGLELSKQFLNLGNTVIITGRDQSKLDEAKKNFPAIKTVQSDAGDPNAVTQLCAKVTSEFPDLNVLINNAGIMRRTNFHDKAADLVDFTREIEINLMGPIRLVNQLLPHLKMKKSAAIVNVSSGLAFVPLPLSPIYCATKAGMHSFTQSLRVQMKNTNVQIFELAPPAVETSLLRKDFSADDLKGVTAMPVQTLSTLAIEGLANDVMEIRPGGSNFLKLMSRIAPEFILKQLGKSTEQMVANNR